MTMGDRIAVMNKGKLQQVGSASEIYHKPVNVFVAGFIGSPQMNFLDMKMSSKGTKSFLEGHGIEIPMNSDPGHEDVIVGIRPEHIGLKDGDVSFTAEVFFVEKLMSSTIIHANLEDGSEIVAMVPGDHEFKNGERMTMYFDIDKVHLFDPKTERRIEL